MSVLPFVPGMTAAPGAPGAVAPDAGADSDTLGSGAQEGGAFVDALAAAMAGLVPATAPAPPTPPAPAAAGDGTSLPSIATAPPGAPSTNLPPVADASPRTAGAATAGPQTSRLGENLQPAGESADPEMGRLGTSLAAGEPAHPHSSDAPSRLARTSLLGEGLPAGASPAPDAAGSPRDAGESSLPVASSAREAATRLHTLMNQQPAHPSPATTSETVPGTNPAAAITSAASTSKQAPGTHHAVQQVLPAVMQLATKGNGTHRISVTLQPEHLGEVRVTLVVRDGTVRVSLAADQARDTLLQGAPELRRLLEATGMTDARVVVRDLGGTAPAPSAAGTGANGGPATSGHGTTDDPSEGRGAGSTAAQDGSPGQQARDERDRRREARGAVPTDALPTAPAGTPTTGRLDRTM